MVCASACYVGDLFARCSMQHGIPVGATKHHHPGTPFSTSTCRTGHGNAVMLHGWQPVRVWRFPLHSHVKQCSHVVLVKVYHELIELRNVIRAQHLCAFNSSSRGNRNGQVRKRLSVYTVCYLINGPMVGSAVETNSTIQVLLRLVNLMALERCSCRQNIERPA